MDIYRLTTEVSLPIITEVHGALDVILQAPIAAHKKQVEVVRRCLPEGFKGGPSAKLKKYQVHLVSFPNPPLLQLENFSLMLIRVSD